MVFSDYMAFPVSVADDGLIDIIAMAKVCYRKSLHVVQSSYHEL
jgi:hypothetical protein